MQRDTIVDWQSLTKLYGEMSDGELYALNDDIANLTEVAQQVLRDEMKKRGLNEPLMAEEEPNASDLAVDSRSDIDAGSRRFDDESEESGPPDEFTWKTPLCECDDSEAAAQIRLALQQAGIESWLDGQGYRVVADFNNPRILVAADQLDQAREILSQPIPQTIIDQSQMPIPEYEPPVCPACGAEDPILENADPVNSWLCESCGKQWTEAAEAADECAAQPGTDLVS
jgi:hypothetical protein